MKLDWSYQAKSQGTLFFKVYLFRQNFLSKSEVDILPEAPIGIKGKDYEQLKDSGKPNRIVNDKKKSGTAIQEKDLSNSQTNEHPSRSHKKPQ